MPVMRATPPGSVQAIVCVDDWPEPVRVAVLASLRGQVAQVVAEAGGLQSASGADVLVVTGPVVFARGALARIRAQLDEPGRAVVRVLVPGEDPASVALWSGEWIARAGVDAESLMSGGLDIDRKQLPHDDPRARAWVRADDVGIARCTDPGRAAGWSRREGVQLSLRRVLTSLRSLLGQAKRRRHLARQRRQHEKGLSGQVR